MMREPRPSMSDETNVYDAFAAAYVRGMLDDLQASDHAQAIASGRARGLKLHRFKRSAQLPRVRAVLGILRSLAPADLLDIGSGRGVFLWMARAADGRPLRCLRGSAVPRCRQAREDVDRGGPRDLARTFLQGREHGARPVVADGRAARTPRADRRSGGASPGAVRLSRSRRPVADRGRDQFAHAQRPARLHCRSRRARARLPGSGQDHRAGRVVSPLLR